METWLHGANTRLNGNLPFLARTKEFRTTVTGPLIRNYNFQIPSRKRKFAERRRVNNKQTELGQLSHNEPRSRGTERGLETNLIVDLIFFTVSIFFHIFRQRDSSPFKIISSPVGVITVEYFRRK